VVGGCDVDGGEWLVVGGGGMSERLGWAEWASLRTKSYEGLPPEVGAFNS